MALQHFMMPGVPVYCEILPPKATACASVGLVLKFKEGVFVVIFLPSPCQWTSMRSESESQKLVMFTDCDNESLDVEGSRCCSLEQNQPAGTSIPCYRRILGSASVSGRKSVCSQTLHTGILTLHMDWRHAHALRPDCTVPWRNLRCVHPC